MHYSSFYIIIVVENSKQKLMKTHFNTMIFKVALQRLFKDSLTGPFINLNSLAIFKFTKNISGIVVVFRVLFPV